MFLSTSQMDIGVVVGVFLFILPVHQTNVTEEYSDTYWVNYNYTPSGPYFDKSYSQNVTCLQGLTAYLRCRTLNDENRTISWLRYRDLHLLTVGLQTYINDQRFTIVYIPPLNEWTLQIKYAQIKDSGIYICQISTSPPTIRFVHLLVTRTSVKILGGPEIYISEKGLLNLTCIVEHFIPNLPFQIKWTHNNKEVKYDSLRGGVSVVTEKYEDVIKSYLLIQNAKSSDSGVYICSQASLISREIIVHVLIDNPSEAMRNNGERTQTKFEIIRLLLLCILSCFYEIK